MARRIGVPCDVRDAARRALANRPHDVPEVAYRLASGWAEADDREIVALWCLDNGTEFNGTRCTVAAALRGGNAGMRWAVTGSLGGKDDLIQQALDATVRSDQQLTQQIAAAIIVAWDRQLDHSARKARSRLSRSTQGRVMDFVGWPNRDVAIYAGIDDLMDRAWDAFVASLTVLLADYARTQATLVAAVDELGADAVRRAIMARLQGIVNSLVGFLDTRLRAYIVGEIPYAPQDFAAARTVAAWASGAAGSPVGFAWNDLVVGQFTTDLSTAQEALLAAAATRPDRTFTWLHSYYGAPLIPFPPHEALDGEVFTVDELASLSLFPGDHLGCRCEVIPDWGF